MNLKVIHKVAILTSVHPRFDARIYHREILALLSSDFKLDLFVADGNGYEKRGKLNIFDIGKPKNRLIRFFITTRKIYKRVVQQDYNVVHFHDPELMFVGLLLKKRGLRVIYDIHENTDLQILTKNWMPNFLRPLISILFSRIENFVAKRFDLLIVPQPLMLEKFLKINKTVLIGNYPFKKEIDYSEKKILNKKRILYAGSLSVDRGLKNMLDLITHLNILESGYELTLAGSIHENDLIEAKKHQGWSYTNYVGLLKKSELSELYKRNSIGLIMFENSGQYFMSHSLKLFEYMCNGFTVIMPDFGEWVNFQKNNQIGYLCDYRNIRNTAERINSLTYAEMLKFSQNGKKLISEKYNFDIEKSKLVQTYRSLFDDKI